MCGIAGIVAPEAARYSASLQAMTGRLAHRGPDGAGHHYFSGCALGHRRLSIVDLEGGAQPMLAGEGELGITFNGEIYGYRQLRDALSPYSFRTSSDTEVILALYQRYGSALLEHLPGMFAFGLWDNRSRELICARDRFGEKPLYYAFGPAGEFLFASEIKSLLASGLVRPILDNAALAHYLQYLHVPPGRSIYANIFCLPPAHLLRYRDGRVTVERYWHLPEPAPQISAEDAVVEFRRLLDQAVTRQLVADVPVGAFLSGGLDSSTIVAVAAGHQPGLKTFSFGFGQDINELPLARSVARRYATDHTELGDSDANLADLLTTMQDVYDEPFGDSSNIPTYLLARHSREHVKVALTGDGGDELFGGYSDWYRPLLQMQAGRSSLPVLTRLLRGATILARRAGLGINRSRMQRLQGRYLSDRHRSVAAAHLAQKQVFRAPELASLGLLPPPAPPETGGPGSLDDALRQDLQGYMPGDILTKIDRAAMAHGLELRAPFLDRDFASFCISLPWQLKLNETTDKLILRQAYEQAWPTEVQQHGKQGFGAPLQRWLQRPDMSMLKQDLLLNSSSRIFTLLPFGAAQTFVRQENTRTWALLVLALWLERSGRELSWS